MLNFVSKNIKKIGLFVAVLLLAALVLCFIRFFKPCAVPLRYVQDAVYILTVLAGFEYTFGGFKKNAAKSYKLFMLLACLECVLLLIYDMISSAGDGQQDSVSAVLEMANCVNIFILTFSKNLGKDSSVGLGCAVLGVTVVNSVRLLILYPDNFVVVSRAVMSLALSSLICLFILAKYADKAKRNTN